MIEFERLKVGDRVILHQRYQHDQIRIIEKITKLYIIVGGVKYRKDTGSQYDGYTFSSIGIATNDEIKRITKEGIRRRIIEELSHNDWYKYSDDFLNKIYKLVEEEDSKISD